MKETRYEPMVINWDDDEWHLQGRLRKAPRDVFPYDLPLEPPRTPDHVRIAEIRGGVIRYLVQMGVR